MLRLIVLGLLAAVTSSVNAADADSRFDCSVFAKVVSRSLFDSSGTFASTGPALIAIPECVERATGFYGNLFLSVPLQNFDAGKEVDVALGRRFKASAVDVDVSAAYWYFGIGAPVGSRNMYDTGDARIKISRSFGLSENLHLRPYVVADYQRSFTLHANQLGFEAGSKVNSKLNWLPGTPDFSASLGGWYYPTTWNPGKGPVWHVDLDLSYQVSEKFSLGPCVRRTWGDVLHPSDHTPKSYAGACMFASF